MYPRLAIASRSPSAGDCIAIKADAEGGGSASASGMGMREGAAGGVAAAGSAGGAVAPPHAMLTASAADESAGRHV